MDVIEKEELDELNENLPKPPEGFKLDVAKSKKF